MSELRSRLTCRDFATYYSKLFSSLSKQEANFLCKLIQASESDGIVLTNSIRHEEFGMKMHLSARNIKLNKKRFLEGLLSGASLDYFEAVSKNARLLPLEKAEVSGKNSILFLSNAGKEGKTRRLNDFLKLYESKASETESYCAFVTHTANRNDYALVGERETPGVLARIPKAVG